MGEGAKSRRGDTVTRKLGDTETDDRHRELYGLRSDPIKRRLLRSLFSLRLPRRPQWVGLLAMTNARHGISRQDQQDLQDFSHAKSQSLILVIGHQSSACHAVVRRTKAGPKGAGVRKVLSFQIQLGSSQFVNIPIQSNYTRRSGFSVILYTDDR